MAGGTVSRTPHFVLHRAPLASSGSPGPEPHERRQVLFVIGDEPWIGAVVPKRWARRAVTRNGIRRQITSELERVVEAGQLDGSFDVADVRMTTDSLLSLGIDVSRWYQDSSRITPQQIADHHVHLALRIVGARPRALPVSGQPDRAPSPQVDAPRVEDLAQQA